MKVLTTKERALRDEIAALKAEYQASPSPATKARLSAKHREVTALRKAALPDAIAGLRATLAGPIASPRARAEARKDLAALEAEARELGLALPAAED